MGLSIAGLSDHQYPLAHCACYLIWAILARLKIPCPFLAALLFAVHPVNVESVAWIFSAEELSSARFFLASILCYLQADDPAKGTKKVSLGWLGLSLAAFCPGDAQQRLGRHAASDPARIDLGGLAA